MKRRIATVALTAVLLLLPFAIVVKTLICEGISVPQWDDWWTVEYYKNTVENGFNLHDLLNMRANEHRIIVPVILRTMIWSLSGCNGIVELIVDQMIVLLAFGIIVLYWYKKKLPMIALLPVSVIVFSFKLGMLQVWGMSIQWWTLVLFSVLSFYCYQKFIQNGK